MKWSNKSIIGVSEVERVNEIENISEKLMT